MASLTFHGNDKDQIQSDGHAACPEWEEKRSRCAVLVCETPNHAIFSLVIFQIKAIDFLDVGIIFPGLYREKQN